LALIGSGLLPCFCASNLGGADSSFSPLILRRRKFVSTADLNPNPDETSGER
jgi:hypothetical protein